jgi:hypothetical protein
MVENPNLEINSSKLSSGAGAFCPAMWMSNLLRRTAALCKGKSKIKPIKLQPSALQMKQ